MYYKHNYTEKYSLQGIVFNFWNKIIQEVKNLIYSTQEIHYELFLLLFRSE